MRAMLSANLAVDARFVVVAAAAVLEISSTMSPRMRSSSLCLDWVLAMTSAGHGKRNTRSGDDVSPQGYK